MSKSPELPKPFVVRNFLEGKMLSLFQNHAAEIKKQVMNSGPKEKLFNRYMYHNDARFSLYHHKLIAPLAEQLFGQPLKPSYNFLSFYLPGEGECPIHVDREQCLVTVDICLNQSRVWPIYVNSSRNFNNNGVDMYFQEDPEERERIKLGSDEFLLNPGDALCYSGTNHAHWRKKIDDDNFCDLIFFHFVDKDFTGNLS